MPKNVQAKVTVKVPDSATPWTIQSMEFSRPEYWSSSLYLLQGIVPTQGSNPGLPHCRWILHQLSHKGNQRMFELPYTVLISHASKVMLKILQARLQQYMNWELLDVQAGFRKGRGTRDQIANICWIIEKSREFQKNIYFCFIDYTKAFDCVDHNNLWKILQEMGKPDHLTCLLRKLYQVKKQQLEPDMEQWTGSKLGKEYIKAVYCHPAYLTYMQSTSWETLGWMKHKLESRLLGEISITSDMQITPP